MKFFITLLRDTQVAPQYKNFVINLESYKNNCFI